MHGYDDNITYLQQSQNELSKIIDQQNIQAESSCRALDEIQSREGDLLHQQIQQLEQIQIQRGVILQHPNSIGSNANNDTGVNIASQMALSQGKATSFRTRAYTSLCIPHTKHRPCSMV